MTAQQLKSAIAKKRAEMKALNDTCLVNGEFRAMSDDDKKKFDDMKTCLKSMEEMYEAMSEMGLDKEEAKSDNPTGRRVSEPMTLDGGPAIHTEKHRYSILRAMRHSLERKPQDGLEGEVHTELAKRSEKQPQGFLVPMGNEPELRGLLKDTYETRGDLTTSTGTGAVFVSPMLPFIELLRNRIVLRKLGATFLSGMEGKFSIPRQSQAGASAWIAEGSSLTANNQTLDQVAFVNKTLGAATNISRKFIYQSSIDAESFVMNDLAKVLAIAFDYAGINGSGSGAVPTGILQSSAIQTLNTAAGLSSGTNGGAITWANVVKLETTVANANADMDNLAYLTCPAVRGTMKVTPKIGTTFPVFMWEGGDGVAGMGEVNNYPAWATNQVPNNLTKASGSALGALIYGDWSSLVMAQWGGVDVVVNPFTNQLSGAITISMLTEGDVEIRHPESFAFLSDIQY